MIEQVIHGELVQIARRLPMLDGTAYRYLWRMALSGYWPSQFAGALLLVVHVLVFAALTLGFVIGGRV